MNPKERLAEIQARWEAFVHWSGKVQPFSYEESAGPDVEWLIKRVKKLEAALDKIEDPNSAVMETTGRPSFADWELRLIARKALEGEK